MRWTVGVAASIVLTTGCGASGAVAAHSPSPSPLASAAAPPSEVAVSPSPSPVTPSPSPSPMPSPSPVPQVACHGGASLGAMVLIEGYQQELLYDVSDALRPRLLCHLSNTSAHLFTGDTFEYLNPGSANETDVMVHSLGSGNESHAGSFPFYMTSSAWLPDGSVAAFITQVAPDNNNYPSGGWQVWLYAQRRLAPLYVYRQGIGDCICRFCLPGEGLSISPARHYLVAGLVPGQV